MRNAAPGDVPSSAIFVSTQHWNSPFQLGSHHIALAFARRGWRVGFISAPVSPLHLLGLGAQRRERLQAWRSGGAIDPETGVWHYVPFAPLPWGAVRGLRGPRHLALAGRWMAPALRRALADAGFVRPDVGYTDHVLHAAMLHAAAPRRTVFRVADRLSAFPGATADFDARVRSFAAAADLVVCTTPSLRDDLAAGLARSPLLVENGVDLERFRTLQEPPALYGEDPRPVAIYVGAAEDWLDLALLERIARDHPRVHVVVAGPFAGSAARRLRAAGASVVGPVAHAQLPGFLQHARIGLLPFDAARRPALVRDINPLKVYEYLAAGLPVLAMRGCRLPCQPDGWIHETDTRDAFVSSLAPLVAMPRPVPAPQLDDCDWSARLRPLWERVDAWSNPQAPR